MSDGKFTDLSKDEIANLGMSGKMQFLKDAMKDGIFTAPLTQRREQIRELLITKLDSDEQILWYGQPDPEVAAARSSRKLWFFVSVLLAAIVCLEAVPVGFKLGLVAIALVTLYWGIKSPSFDKKMAKQTLYAVTDRQVIELKSVDDKPKGTPVKWFLMRHNKNHLVEPVKKKLAKTPRASDVIYSIIEGIDSDSTKTTHMFSGITDADNAINALRKLRAGLT